MRSVSQSIRYTRARSYIYTYQCAGLLRGSVADDHGHADDRDGDHEEAQTEQNEELQFAIFECEQKSLKGGVDCIYIYIILPDEGKAGAEDQR